MDLAPEGGRRRTRRRGGFATEAEAVQELVAVLEGELSGAYEERRTTVADYLREWLAARKEDLTVNTYAGYKAYVERDLVPAFGRCRLLDLRPKQIEDWMAAQRRAGRGRVTLYRVVSTLRNALNHAVRSWRLKFNPAEHCVPPKPRAQCRALRAAQAPRAGAHLLDPEGSGGVPAPQRRSVRGPAGRPVRGPARYRHAPR
ncbi:hypothetical protein OHV13_24435 [Kitasatospora purpeofusca]|uniref:hypothetical protein n=1 Tax=Kitasatospora purpeofusca TaxID=67352 RepID=UPI00324EC010